MDGLRQFRPEHGQPDGAILLYPTAMPLEIQVKRIDPGITVLSFLGKIAAVEDTRRIEDKLSELLRRNCKKIIFDLTDVSYLDSSGLGVLAYCSAAANSAGCAFRVAGAMGIVQRLIEITKLDQIIRSHPTVEAAVKSFEP